MGKEPVVPEFILILKPPTHTVKACSFFNRKDFPNLGPKINEKAGFANASISVQPKFISRAINPPPIPMVGVNPNPKVVPLKFALVFAVNTSFQLLVESGTQTPRSTAVEEFDLAKIP